VPPFFTATTEACNAYQHKGSFLRGLWSQMLSALKKVEAKAGKSFGDPKNPLLVSAVRELSSRCRNDGPVPTSASRMRLPRA